MMKTFENFNKEDNIIFVIGDNSYDNIYVEKKTEIIDMLKIYFEDCGYENYEYVGNKEHKMYFEYYFTDLEDGEERKFIINKYNLLTKDKIEKWKLRKNMKEFNI